MSTPLEENTAALVEILNEVNTLPDADYIKTVNGVGPDASYNVQLTPEDIGAKAQPIKVEGTGAINVTIEDNTEYNFTDVSSLNITGSDGEAHGFVTFGNEEPTVTLAGFKGIGGDDVRIALANQVWEFSAFNGYMIWKSW